MTGILSENNDQRLEDIRLKKKVILAAILLGAATLATGCTPKKTDTMIQADPDFQTKDGIKLDFDQLHNDAIDGMTSIEDGEPFVFISDLDISGDDSAKTITIRAKSVEGTTADDCENFAAALLAQINDAAVNQDSNYEASSTTSFGTLYNSYAIDLEVTDETSGDTVYTLNVAAGDDIGVNPDYEKYIEDWERDLEIYKSNLVYDVNGNIARNGNE